MRKCYVVLGAFIGDGYLPVKSIFTSKKLANEYIDAIIGIYGKNPVEDEYYLGNQEIRRVEFDMKLAFVDNKMEYKPYIMLVRSFDLLSHNPYHGAWKKLLKA